MIFIYKAFLLFSYCPVGCRQLGLAGQQRQIREQVYFSFRRQSSPNSQTLMVSTSKAVMIKKGVSIASMHFCFKPGEVCN